MRGRSSPTDSAGGARYSIIYNFLPVTSRGGGVAPGAECPWTTDAHELGHSIGAATGGPQNNDGAHVWDCYNDIMSYAAVTSCIQLTFQLDGAHVVTVEGLRDGNELNPIRIG